MDQNRIPVQKQVSTSPQVLSQAAPNGFSQSLQFPTQQQQHQQQLPSAVLLQPQQQLQKQKDLRDLVEQKNPTQSHILIQDGDEPKYKCPYEQCGRIFKRRDHLTRHKKNHTNKKLYCERCNAEFTRRDLLNRHLKRHSQKDKNGERLITRRKMWSVETGYVSNNTHINVKSSANLKLTGGAKRTNNDDDELKTQGYPQNSQYDANVNVDLHNRMRAQSSLPNQAQLGRSVYSQESYNPTYASNQVDPYAIDGADKNRSSYISYPSSSSSSSMNTIYPQYQNYSSLPPAITTSNSYPGVAVPVNVNIPGSVAPANSGSAYPLPYFNSVDPQATQRHTYYQSNSSSSSVQQPSSTPSSSSIKVYGEPSQYSAPHSSPSLTSYYSQDRKVGKVDSNSQFHNRCLNHNRRHFLKILPYIH